MDQNSMIKVLKAALPYMSASGGRALSVVLAMEEMKQTLNYISGNGENSNLEVCSIEESKRTPANMIDDIKKVLPENERAKIDNILNIINTINMMNIINTNT